MYCLHTSLTLRINPINYIHFLVWQAHENHHTQTYSCAVRYTHIQQSAPWVIHPWIRIQRLYRTVLYMWLIQFKTTWFMTPLVSVLPICLWMWISIYEPFCGYTCVITPTCLWLHTCPGWHSQKLPKCLFPLHVNQLVGHPPGLLACSPGRSAGRVGTTSGENILKAGEETNMSPKYNFIIFHY